MNAQHNTALRHWQTAPNHGRHPGNPRSHTSNMGKAFPAVLATQNFARTPNDQIWSARVLPGSESTSVQIEDLFRTTADQARSLRVI